jgi:hypothetical protein
MTNITITKRPDYFVARCGNLSAPGVTEAAAIGQLIINNPDLFSVGEISYDTTHELTGYYVAFGGHSRIIARSTNNPSRTA